MGLKTKKERLIGIDFARAFCAVGIIAYHFYCHSESHYKPIHEYANGAWGGLLVAVFIMISGAMLYYNYPEVGSLKTFYFKRLKTLLPAFYIAYLYFYLEMVYATGTPFFAGNPAKLLLTVVGMDGYLLYLGGNYYLIGEWFMGIILILYLLYPVLAWGLRKNPLVTGLVMLVAYGWLCLTNIFQINIDCNVISCAASFFMGMLLVKYKKQLLDNRWLLIPAALLSVVLYIFELPYSYNLHNISVHVFGFCLLLLLYHIGCVLMKVPALGRLIAVMGALSYPVFLLQHRVILKVLGAKNPVSTWKSGLLLLATIVLTFLYAKVLQIVTDAVVKSAWFSRLEEKITGKKK